MSSHSSRVSLRNTGNRGSCLVVRYSWQGVHRSRQSISSWCRAVRIQGRWAIQEIVSIHSSLRLLWESSMLDSVLRLRRLYLTSDPSRQISGFEDSHFWIFLSWWRVVCLQSFSDSWSLASMANRVMHLLMHLVSMLLFSSISSVILKEIRRVSSWWIRIIIVMLHILSTKARSLSILSLGGQPHRRESDMRGVIT